MATWGHMITLAGPLGMTCGHVSRDSGRRLLLRAPGLLLWAASLAKPLEPHGHLKTPATPCGHHDHPWEMLPLLVMSSRAPPPP